MKNYKAHMGRWFAAAVALGLALAVCRFMHGQRLNRDLIDAVKHNDTRAVVELLDEGTDANSCEYDRRDRPLTVRLREFWQKATHRTPRVDESTDIRLTALEVLLAERQDQKGNITRPQENVAIIRSLLSHGANPNVHTLSYTTPLERAIYLDQEDSALMLLAHGAKPPADPGECIVFLLHSSPELFTALVQHGINMNTHDAYGYTALTCACPVVDYHYLRAYDYILPVRLRYARVDDDIYPYLDMPPQLPDYPGCVARLISTGAQVNAANYLGETVLMGAAQSCDLPDIKLLIKAGATVDMVDKSGKSALDYTNEPWAVPSTRAHDRAAARSLLLQALHRSRVKDVSRKHVP